MRLPRVSFLFASPAWRTLLLCLVETIVVTTGAWVTHRVFGDPSTAVHDSATCAFAVLFAWTAMLMSRVAHCNERVLSTVSAWVFAEAAATVLVKSIYPEFQPTLASFTCWSASTVLGVVLWRAWAMSRTRPCAVAVVGRGATCAALMRSVSARDDSSYRIVAHFDTAASDAANISGVPSFLELDAFVAYVRSHGVRELWLTQEATLTRFLDVFRDDLLDIRFVPDLSHLARFSKGAAQQDNTLAIDLVACPLSADSRAFKTLFDFVFAACALLAIAPVLLAIALAVRISSPGPVLFTQRRRGANGVPFDIYKFRTMRLHESGEGVVHQAMRDDPRVTRVGAFLRRTSLDELPQFINVLRGEMSVVGPRPHAIEHDAVYQNLVGGYLQRYRLKPGITGWAQVNGLRGETDSIEKMKQRVEHDLYYLDNWSFGLDVRIVLLTVTRGFVHGNAY